MAMLTEFAPITAEQLLDQPDDGVERWIENGVLREKPMTRRNWMHSELMVSIATSLRLWRNSRLRPRGMVVCGEAAVRLRRNPESTVGVDVAYIPPEITPSQDSDAAVIEGAPTLVVEILSPSDKTEEIDKKIDLYLACGVPLVWIVDPHDRTITAHQPGQPPLFFNETHELTAEPHLPAFRVSMAELFD